MANSSCRVYANKAHQVLLLVIYFGLHVSAALAKASPQPAPTPRRIKPPRPEQFPVHRPLANLKEAAEQLVGRDGPRYPEENFLQYVRACRALDTISPAAARSRGSPPSPSFKECDLGYSVLTLANNFAMNTVVPVLLDSLKRVPMPATQPNGSAATLAHHTTVVGATDPAFNSCRRLSRQYQHTCAIDSSSGLYDEEVRLPDFRAVAFGLAKLKYIVNALTTNTAILYVDADVVFLRDPFPFLLGLSADIAVIAASESCGSRPTPWDAEAAAKEEHEQLVEQEQQGVGPQTGGAPSAEAATAIGAHGPGAPAFGAQGTGAAGTAPGSQAAATAAAGDSAPGQQGSRRRVLEDGGNATAARSSDNSVTSADGPTSVAEPPAFLSYSTGVTFYRSTPGVLRCVYSLLLDLANLAQAGEPNGPMRVREQERFAAFMPMCAGALGMGLEVLPAAQYVTTCGAAGEASPSDGRTEAGEASPVLVHVSGQEGSSLGSRAREMRRWLGGAS